MTINTFCNAFPNGRPRKLRTNAISDELYDAGGNSLGCSVGCRMECLKWILRSLEKELSIQTHHLWYDPVPRSVFFNNYEKMTSYLNFGNYEIFVPTRKPTRKFG